MSRKNSRYWKKSWGQTENKIQRPPHLKGKQIGLYFRDLHRKEKPAKQFVINLQIPPSVESKIKKNLQIITNIAEKLKIPTQTKKLFIKQEKDTGETEWIPNMTDSSVKDDFTNHDYFTGTPADDKNKMNISQESINDSNIQISNLPITNTQDYIKIEPCTSTSAQKHFKTEPVATTESDVEIKTKDPFKKPDLPVTFSDLNKRGVSGPDFISFSNPKQIPKECTLEYVERPNTTPSTSISSAPNSVLIGSSTSNFKSNEPLLSLRGAGDYKYGYEDIITGSFDEKLDKCLSKGVKIHFSNENTKEINKSFYEEHQNMLTKKGYLKLLEFRKLLPAYKKSNELLEVINNNQVIVISGETGCGKSTQVPQIILDHAICNNRGANVKILVTQPRRIAASSLASRVAEERGERLGNSVGYAVRLEKVDSRPRGSIFFCTTGVLLADLEVNQGLTNYSHVILDEVHERDCHIDLSMCMLKKVLQKRKDLKLILMSATLDADTLSAYFDNCPMMHIEGLAYPVKDIYLEEVLQMTKFKLDEPQQRNQPKWMQHRKRSLQAINMERDIQYKAEIAPWLESIKKKIDRDVYLTLQDARIEDLNVDLVFELLTHLRQEPPGAILVFLPGIGDISKLMSLMNDSNMFPSSLYEIYPLHSKLPTLQQHKIFERPPAPVRKIIIATNIAETSITIDDIIYVVDCGKIKMSGLNVDENVSTLKTEWVSQANLRQRRGRAGRCQPGICYHLVTSYRAQMLAERLLPELQRSNLLEPVLMIKKLRLGIACDALMTVPSPPAMSTVQWAVKHLQQCGALDTKETLTPLGWHLARLPVHPSAGKLVLLGALFGCLDRAASVAAVWGFKDPFMLVIGKETEVDEAKRRFALGEPSDHVAISEAIIQWEQCPRQHRRSFAYENFLSNNTLELLSDMKKQLGDSLRQMGFLCTGNVKEAWENRNALNLSLFKAIVAASLYPNIATVRWTNSKNPRKQGRIRVRTPEDSRGVSVHPSSVMTAPQKPGVNVKLCDNPGANWLVYWLKQRSSDLFLLEVTLVYTLPLLFFGELKVSVDETNEESECYMSISTVKVRCKRETSEMLYELRSLLDQVLASKVMVSSDHAVKHCDFEEGVLNAVIEVITAEDERVEYLDYDGDDQSESDHSEIESKQPWGNGRGRCRR